MSHRLVDPARLEPFLEEEFIRASGPGGQHVNRTESAVCLRFRAGAPGAVPPAVLVRLRALAGQRMTVDDVLVLKVMEHRSQKQNRERAREELRDLLLRAAVAPKTRRPTKPTRASKTRRLDAKGRDARVKKNRRPPSAD